MCLQPYVVHPCHIIAHPDLAPPQRSAQMQRSVHRSTDPAPSPYDAYGSSATTERIKAAIAIEQYLRSSKAKQSGCLLGAFKYIAFIWSYHRSFKAPSEVRPACLSNAAAALRRAALFGTAAEKCHRLIERMSDPAELVRGHVSRGPGCHGKRSGRGPHVERAATVGGSGLAAV